MSNSAWISSSCVNKKPWGQEIIVSNSSNIVAKLIRIRAGEQTSFKYNKVKFENYIKYLVVMLNYNSCFSAIFS